MRFARTPLMKIALRYGLLAGGIAGVVVVVLYYLGQHPLMIPTFFDFRIVLFGLFIYFGLKEFRDQHQQGLLYFWQAMVGSYIIIFVGALVSSLIITLYCEIDSNFIASYIPLREAFWRNFSEPEVTALGGKEELERNIIQLRATTSKDIGITYFGQGIILGLLVSIIVSVILRKTTQK